MKTARAARRSRMWQATFQYHDLERVKVEDDFDDIDVQNLAASTLHIPRSDNHAA